MTALPGFRSNSIHLKRDAVCAEKTVFRKRIAHGALMFAITTGLMNAMEITKGEFIGFLEQIRNGPHRYSSVTRFISG